MGGVGDALEFGAGEMAFEPARLLRQYAAGRGDLDDVGAGARRLADLFGAFERSEEHTSELQSLMRNSYAVFCLQKKTQLRQAQLNEIASTRAHTSSSYAPT